MTPVVQRVRTEMAGQLITRWTASWPTSASSPPSTYRLPARAAMLMGKEELSRIWVLRKFMSDMTAVEAMEFPP